HDLLLLQMPRRHPRFTLFPYTTLFRSSLLSSIATEDRVRQIDSNLIVETKKVLNQLKLGIDRIRRTSIAFQIGLIRKAIHPVNSDRKSTRLNSSHVKISYAVFCLKKKK